MHTKSEYYVDVIRYKGCRTYESHGPFITYKDAEKFEDDNNLKINWQHYYLSIRREEDEQC